MRHRLIVVALVLVACGGEPQTTPHDATTAPVSDARLVLTGGGRASGGSLTADVTFGIAFAPRATSGGSVTTTPVTPVTP